MESSIVKFINAVVNNVNVIIH